MTAPRTHTAGGMSNPSSIRQPTINSASYVASIIDHIMISSLDTTIRPCRTSPPPIFHSAMERASTCNERITQLAPRPPGIAIIQKNPPSPQPPPPRPSLSPSPPLARPSRSGWSGHQESRPVSRLNGPAAPKFLCSTSQRQASPRPRSPLPHPPPWA